MTPVWFLFENERLYVPSSSTTRKVKNITARPEVSLMVDVRKLGSEKWVYASGSAEIVSGEESKKIQAKILRRYLTNAGLEDSRVGPVMAAGDDIIIEIIPKTWRFWDMKPLDEQFFGGLLSESPEKWFLPLDG
jgi:nitroimidazol reductase NimA-like FMN-containing flavoprotein (pyridoxamine 5'-phosphate oxidase superfamily)